MNKEELVQEVSKKAKVTQKEAADVINAWMETVEKTVAKGGKVTLVGFGTFEARLLLKKYLLSQPVKNSKMQLTANLALKSSIKTQNAKAAFLGGFLVCFETYLSF